MDENGVTGVTVRDEIFVVFITDGEVSLDDLLSPYKVILCKGDPSQCVKIWAAGKEV
jgi:hypothetical protein